MPLKARGLVLTKSHAACLTALRNGKVAKPEIAILAKLDLTNTAAALGTLAQLGLVKQIQEKRWHATRRGKVCRFKVIPDRLRRNSGVPGSGGRRLLNLLHRPMRGNQIVEKLGVSHQRVRQLVIKLHAQGYVTFGDEENPFWIIRRTDDRTTLLSRDEEHVLSAIPREYLTNIIKIRLAARMPENKIRKILEGLMLAVSSKNLMDCKATEFIGSRMQVITTLNAIYPLAAQRNHAYLLNQTVYEKCFQRF